MSTKSVLYKTQKMVTGRDCGICCLAMAMRKPYDEVYADVMQVNEILYAGQDFSGTDRTIDSLVFWKNGFVGFYYNVIPATEGKRKKYKIVDDCGNELELKYSLRTSRELVGKGECILSVPSVNISGCYHGVYWDGKCLHDPQNKKTYPKNGKKAFDAAHAVIMWQRLSPI